MNAEQSSHNSKSTEKRPDTAASAVQSQDLKDVGAGPLERASLSSSLALIGQRLTSLEARLQNTAGEAKPTSPTWLEFAKIVFGGWPAFGLIFMLLFYGPVRDAINALPEKVKSAEEMSVLGVSLKTTIRVEAEKIGSIQLSQTLPTLSPAAVEFILRDSPAHNALVSYSKQGDLVKTVWFPSEKTLKILEELEKKKLAAVHVIGELPVDTVSKIRKGIADFRKKYPGRVAAAGSIDPDRIAFDLTPPADVVVPAYSWNLTDLGKNAVSVILKAVSVQLTPHPQSGDRSTR
ncbi:hypothetical protein [Achromobacter sp.]|uniref:hypothetical protein n=1 Tax=Achromobacter sp. TaxID=134375 RepID=UPI0028AA4A3C|nr:hypothetical protein [Achromobacter sp.]